MFNKQCEERVVPVPPWLETTLMSSLKSQPAGGDLYELKPRYFEKLKAVAALLIPIWQAYIYIYIPWKIWNNRSSIAWNEFIYCDREDKKEKKEEMGNKNSQRVAKNRGGIREMGWSDYGRANEAAWREGNVDSPRICIGNAHRIRLNYRGSHKATRDSLSQPSRFTSSRVTAVMNYRPFLLHDLCANVLCIRHEYSRETLHDNSRLYYQSTRPPFSAYYLYFLSFANPLPHYTWKN